MKTKNCLLFLVCLLMTCLAHTTEKSEYSLVVGTYAYKGLDRQEAVTPIARALTASTGQSAEVRLYDSPTKLAEAFFSGDAHIVVPNLAGFAQIAARQKNHLLLFVPDDKGSTYKSSIVMSLNSASLAQSLQSRKQNVGMVWEDSTSGAILGTVYLQTQLQSDMPFNQDKVVYLGSHSNVMTALLAGEIDIGVLATDVYLKRKNNLPEVWRSEAIPFGPALCNQIISQHCGELQRYIMENARVHHQVLENLKEGWPEFTTASRLIIPTYASYESFIRHFEAKR